MYIYFLRKSQFRNFEPFQCERVTLILYGMFFVELSVLTNLLLGAGRRPSQGSASIFCYYYLCYYYLCFPCSKFPARLQSPNSDWAWVLKWKFVAPEFLAGVRVELEDIDQEGWILMFFGFFLLINSSLWLTYTDTSLLSKRRSICRVHTQNCCAWTYPTR